MTDAPSSATEAASGRLREPADRTDSPRTAVAVGRVDVDERTLAAIRERRIPKGDVLQTARTAALLGAKQTSRLIPHCLDVHLQGLEIDLELEDDPAGVGVTAYAKSSGPTGVEMEALTAVSIAALTIYDMCKSISKNIQITGVHLVAKTGGLSGDYLRENAPHSDRS